MRRRVERCVALPRDTSRRDRRSPGEHFESSAPGLRAIDNGEQSHGTE